MARQTSRSDITLSTGLVCKHYAALGNKTIVETSTGEDITDSEWQEYCEIRKAELQGKRRPALFRIEVLDTVPVHDPSFGVRSEKRWLPVNPDQVTDRPYLLFQEATRRSQNNPGVHFRIAREGSKRARLRFYVKPGQVKP